MYCCRITVFIISNISNRCLVIVSLICCLYSPVTAQLPYYKNFNVQNGLPDNEVFDIYQDEQKNMWIATSQGVVKYDGEDFTQYTKKDGLGDNVTFYIRKDKKGRIWFLGYNGTLSFFYNNSFHLYPYNQQLKKNIKGDFIIKNIYVNDIDEVYVGTMGKGIVKVDRKGNMYKLNEPGEKAHKIFGIYPVDSNYLLYVQGSRKKNSDNFLIIHKNQSVDSVFFNRDRYLNNVFLLKRKNNNLLLGVYNNLFEIRNNQIISHNLHSNEIISFYEDRDSNVWIGYKVIGVKKFNKNSSFNEDQAIENYFNKLSISRTLQDYEGNFWFTSLENGIFYIPDLNIKTIIDGTGIFPDFYITAIKSIKNQLLIGTNSGKVYSYKKNKLHELSLNRNIGNVISIQDVKEDIYIKGNKYSVSIDKYNQVKYQSLYVPHVSTQDQNGNLYSCLTRAPFKVSINGDTTELLNDDHVKINTIFCDSKNTIWYGSNHGLYYLNNNTLIKKNIGQISSSHITDIEESNQKLYIATLGNGIAVLSPSSIHFLNTSTGLPSDMINGMVIQKYKKLWVATSRGLCKIDLETNQLEILINDKKGLPSIEVKMLQMINDTLYVGSNNYLSFFNTGLINPDTTSYEILLKNIKVNGIQTSNKKKNVFEYDENNIELNMHSYMYSQSGDITYKYRLKGISNNFTYTSNPVVNFPLLSPGNYTFEAYAINEDKKASNQPLLFTFKIKKPFWRTYWFYFGLSFGFVVIIVSLVYIFFKRKNDKRQLELELLESKQQAFAGQINPHFTFNALNSIQTYILKENKEEAVNYLNKFSKLVRLSLQHTRETMVSLESEINLLSYYIELEHLRHENITYRIHVDPSIHPGKLLIPPMLIQPFVENAIKHGILQKEEGEGHVFIEFTKNKDVLFCTIEDNGVGFNFKTPKNNTLHTSMGIDITLTRLKLLCESYHTPYHFKITNNNRENNPVYPGTSVQFSIPCKYI